MTSEIGPGLSQALQGYEDVRALPRIEGTHKRKSIERCSYCDQKIEKPILFENRVFCSERCGESFERKTRHLSHDGMKDWIVSPLF